MARELGLKVIAEGVEFQAQLDFLRQHGCDEFQGYLSSNALPIDQLELFFRHRKIERAKVNA
jgi:EAL domain-containing protein (putative c-di-GMP-specific phosphodiesterase class I)